MRFIRALSLSLLIAAPGLADDSDFVDEAFAGRWGAQFPDFFGNQVVGPIDFAQISEEAGRAGMDRVRGAGTAAAMCPGPGEKTEFYGGEYDYQDNGEHFGCTNGSKYFGVYDDYAGPNLGTITIEMTFPGAMPPRWEGKFTDRQGLESAMHGVYQGGGIATPLAMVGDGGPTFTSLNGASFQNINGLAPDSWISSFGPQVVSQQVFVDSGLPQNLGGIMVMITDSAGVVHNAGLYVVANGQINFVLPAAAALGPATLMVMQNGQIVVSESIEITAVSPGVFSANASGSGPAAAEYLHIAPDGTRSGGLTFDGNLAAVPLDVNAPGDLYIILYCTGMRNFSGQVEVRIDGLPVPVLGGGPVRQPQFDALDQLNIGPIPPPLAGKGEVEIRILIDGKPANVVTVSFR